MVLSTVIVFRHFWSRNESWIFGSWVEAWEQAPQILAWAKSPLLPMKESSFAHAKSTSDILYKLAKSISLWSYQKNKIMSPKMSGPLTPRPPKQNLDEVRDGACHWQPWCFPLTTLLQSDTGSSGVSHEIKLIELPTLREGSGPKALIPQRSLLVGIDIPGSSFVVVVTLASLRSGATTVSSPHHHPEESQNASDQINLTIGAGRGHEIQWWLFWWCTPWRNDYQILRWQYCPVRVLGLLPDISAEPQQEIPLKIMLVRAGLPARAPFPGLGRGGHTGS